MIQCATCASLKHCPIFFLDEWAQRLSSSFSWLLTTAGRAAAFLKPRIAPLRRRLLWFPGAPPAGHSKCLVMRDLEEAMAVANLYAPEHLILRRTRGDASPDTAQTPQIPTVPWEFIPSVRSCGPIKDLDMPPTAHVGRRSWVVFFLYYRLIKFLRAMSMQWKHLKIFISLHFHFIPSLGAFLPHVRRAQINRDPIVLHCFSLRPFFFGCFGTHTVTPSGSASSEGCGSHR